MVHASLRYLIWEFHYSRLCLCHENDKRFSETPWLPSKWYFQWIYLVFRWIVALFFLAYLILSGAIFSDQGGLYFIYLTNWSFLALNFHLLWSAIFATVRYFQVHVFCKEKSTGSTGYRVYDEPAGCCGIQKDGTLWYHKIQWLLFNIANNAAISVTILFWTLIYRGVADHVSIVTHALNGVMALLDIFISGVPVRILHFVYGIIYCSTYSVFTGIYYGAGGTGFGNQTYIYPVLDYENGPALASGLVVAVPLIFCPLVHLLFLWGLYLAREGLVYLIKHVCFKRCFENEEYKEKSDVI